VTGYLSLLLVVESVLQQNNVLLRHIISGLVQSPLLGWTDVNPKLYIHETSYKKVLCFQVFQLEVELVATMLKWTFLGAQALSPT
jgi:hypothetical protein